MINCYLSSISHHFRDIASQSQKPTPQYDTHDRGDPFEFVIKLGRRRHCAIFKWKRHGPSFSSFVTIYSRHRETDDRRRAYGNSGTCKYQCNCNVPLKNHQFPIWQYHYRIQLLHIIRSLLITVWLGVRILWAYDWMTENTRSFNSRLQTTQLLLRGVRHGNFCLRLWMNSQSQTWIDVYI